MEKRGVGGTAAFLISAEQTLSLITVSGESKLVIHSDRLYRHTVNKTQRALVARYAHKDRHKCKSNCSQYKSLMVVSVQHSIHTQMHIHVQFSLFPDMPAQYYISFLSILFLVMGTVYETHH